VRGPPKSNAAFVHDVLLFLEDQDFPFAPRLLGRDSRGRDILSYLEGETWSGSGSELSDDLLGQVARPSGAIMMRRLPNKRGAFSAKPCFPFLQDITSSFGLN
jgi:hypothetical protein